MAPSRARSAGFTLIEMIVVLVVLGLALTLILSHGRTHSPRLSLDAAARQLVDALHATRGAAIGADRPTTLRLGADGSLTGAAAPSRLREVSVVGCDPHAQAARDLAVTFLADGSARIDGTATDATLCLEADGLTTRIAIDWFTGRVYRQ